MDSTSSPSSTEVVTDPSKCAGEWTTPLAVAAQSADEVPYLSQISACTTQDQRATELINGSDIVWAVFTKPGGAQVIRSAPTLHQSIFRASIPSGHVAVMEPGSTVSIGAAPAATSWYADPVLTSMWRSQSTLVDAGVSRAADAIKSILPEVFAPESDRGKAWIACGLAVYDAADATVKRYGDSLDAQGVPELIKQAQDLGQSARDCQEKLQAVDDADLRAHRISAPTLTTAEELAHGASWAAKAQEDFHGASILRAVSHFHL